MRQIDIDEVSRLHREDDAQLVEVLSEDSYNALHIPGAINMPLAELDEAGSARLDARLPVVTYCYDHQ